VRVPNVTKGAEKEMVYKKDIRGADMCEKDAKNQMKKKTRTRMAKPI